MAKKIKKYAHLLFNLFQPNSSSWNAFLKKYLRQLILKNILLNNKAAAKIILIIVGFMYRKTGLLKYKVKPPKTEINIAPTRGR